MHAVSQARHPRAVRARLIDDAGGRRLDRDRLAGAERNPVRDHPHAVRSRSAVFVADREDAGGNRRRYRLPVARRDQPRRRARRRARAVVGYGREDRVDQRALAFRRQPAAMQQEHRVGECRLSHQLRDVAAANPDRGGLRADDCRAPCVHEGRDYRRCDGSFIRLLRYRHRYLLGWIAAPMLRCLPRGEVYRFPR